MADDTALIMPKGRGHPEMASDMKLALGAIAIETSSEQMATPTAFPPSEAWRVSVHEWTMLPDLDWPSVREDDRYEGYVYQTREFLETWMATVGHARGSRCFLIVATDRDARAALHLALVVEPEYGCRVLRFPDAGMADYNAPLLRGEAGSLGAWAGLWPLVLKSLPHCDLVDFVKMPEEIGGRPNPLLRVLPAEADDFGFYLPVEGTADAYFSDPSRKPRIRKLKQRLRKLERSGPTSIGSPEGAEDIAASGAFIELHKGAQFRRTLGFDQFDKPGIRAFVHALLGPRALGVFTQLTVMRHEGRIACAQLDFVTPRRHQGFLTTFDEEGFSASSPGRQVTMELIARAFAEGLSVFDLGHGDNTYKSPWMTRRMPLFHAEEPLTWRGRVYLLLRRTRRRLRKVSAAMRGRHPAPTAEAEAEPSAS